MSKDLLVKCKKGMHRQRNQGHTFWELYGDAAHICGDTFKKIRAQIVLNLARSGGINKGFYKFLVRKGIVKTVHTPTMHTEK